MTNGPVQLEGAEEVAGRLNKAASVKDLVEAEDVYAAGGFVRDGVIE